MMRRIWGQLRRLTQIGRQVEFKGAGFMEFIDINEFVRHGYLQEVNRQFFHPLGMALVVSVKDGQAQIVGVVKDSGPAGLIFAKGVLDKEKCARVMQEQRRQHEIRTNKLGYYIQPCEEG